MHGLISICIPVFNGEKYLRECLDSVLAQTYSDIEIIIVDDGSTDSSIDISEAYLKKDARIKIFRNATNLGLVQNWNHCIELAKGEWIKFLFQDDLMDSNCIETFVEYISKTAGKIPVLVSKRKYFSDKPFTEKEKLYYETNLLSLDRIKISQENHVVSPHSVSNAAVKYIALNFIGEPTVLMFRRSVCRELGSFEESLEQICDLEFVLRIASVYGMVYVPNELTKFRIHEHSTTNRNMDKKYYSLAFLEPVRLAHIFLFDKRYETFLRQLTVFNLFKLKTYFAVRGYEAYRRAEKSAEDMSTFEISAKKFSRMSLLKKKSISRLILNKLVELKRKINN